MEPVPLPGGNKTGLGYDSDHLGAKSIRSTRQCSNPALPANLTHNQTVIFSELGPGLELARSLFQNVFLFGKFACFLQPRTLDNADHSLPLTRSQAFGQASGRVVCHRN
jgi:hypothetical protein